MPIQSALAQIGIAKQTAKGTAASNPDYAFGVTDGAILTVDVQQSAEEHTSGTLAVADVNRTGVVAGFDFTSRAHAGTLGLLCYSVLGADAYSSNSHTLTVASALPYLTVSGKQSGTTYALQDAKVDSLEFSFNGNDPLEVKASGMGTTVTYTGATFTPATADETTAVYMRPRTGFFGSFSVPYATTYTITQVSQSGNDVTLTTSAAHGLTSGDNITVTGLLSNWLDGAWTCKAGTTGSTIVFSHGLSQTVASYAPTGSPRVAKNYTATNKILSGSVSISRNLQEIMVSGSITPNDVFEGRLDVEVSLDIVMDDWVAWRSIATGTDNGTTAAATPTYGACVLQFSDGTNNASLYLNRVAFTMDVPSANPAGGYLTASLSGIATIPASGSPVIAIVAGTGTKGSAY